MSAASRPARPQSATPRKRTSSKAPLRKASSRQKSLKPASAEGALDECITAISLLDVTVHALESREMAPTEQVVLRLALEAFWMVHDWIDDLRLDEPGSRVRSRE